MSDKVVDVFENDTTGDGAIFHGYTYSGHPAACAAGNAVQDIYVAEDSFQKSADLSEYFLDGLFSLRDIESVKDIRGYGLLGGVEMHPKGGPGARGTQAQKDMFWNGMHIKFTGDTACVAPPFIAEKTHIDELVDKLRMTLENA